MFEHALHEKVLTGTLTRRYIVRVAGQSQTMGEDRVAYSNIYAICEKRVITDRGDRKKMVEVLRCSGR